MTLIYVDAFAGASGDMLLGALLDAGADEQALRRHLGTLPVTGYDLDVRPEVRHGLRVTRAEVRIGHEGKHDHRGLAAVHEILDAGNLPGPAAAQAKAVFRRLAEAEARVHGTTPEEIHFHEVGAVDAIVDIAGVCTGLALLRADRLVCSPLPMGSGYVDVAHGRLPVPVPAVVELVRGCPTADCAERGERTTPTGAAILVTLAETFGPMPAMVPDRVGYGAGGRKGKHLANCLRVIVGRESGTSGEESDTLWLVEANLDDATGEMIGAAAEAILGAGARDVWLTPATMKKGRPGVVVACLADEAARAAVEDAIFLHTPTFGLRRRRVERSILAREHVEVETTFGRVRMKVGRRAGRVVTASPEYADCLRLAGEGGVAVRAVLEAAGAAWDRRSADAGAGE